MYASTGGKNNRLTDMPRQFAEEVGEPSHQERLGASQAHPCAFFRYMLNAWTNSRCPKAASPDRCGGPRGACIRTPGGPGRGDLPRVSRRVPDSGRAARRGSAAVPAGAARAGLQGHLDAAKSQVARRTGLLTPPELAVEVSAWLAGAGVQHAIGGAIAFGFHAEPRGHVKCHLNYRHNGNSMFIWRLRM